MRLCYSTGAWHVTLNLNRSHTFAYTQVLKINDQSYMNPRAPQDIVLFIYIHVIQYTVFALLIMQCNGLACKLMAQRYRKIRYSFSSKDAHANFKFFKGCVFLSKPYYSNRCVDNKRTRGLFICIVRQESIHVFRKRHAARCGGGSGDLLMAKYINPSFQEHKVLVGGLVFVNTYI